MEPLTRAEIEEISEQAANKAVKKTLEAVGVDVKNMQEQQADFYHLRKARLTSEQMGAKAKVTALGFLIAGGLGALWIGIKHQLGID